MSTSPPRTHGAAQRFSDALVEHLLFMCPVCCERRWLEVALPCGHGVCGRCLVQLLGHTPLITLSASRVDSVRSVADLWSVWPSSVCILPLVCPLCRDTFDWVDSAAQRWVPRPGHTVYERVAPRLMGGREMSKEKLKCSKCGGNLGPGF